MTEEKEIKETLSFIRRVSDFKPRLALILGSGLSNLFMRLDVNNAFFSSELPYYPISSVQGHTGRLIFGYLQKDITQSTPLLIFQGRVHFYETGSIERVVFPVLVAHQLGIKVLIITNAAGGINAHFTPGDLMLINDVLNFSLIRPSSYFLDVPFKHSDYFNSTLQQTVIHCALQLGITLRKGTYCWLQGPSYETPAEIQMLERLGTDAVGMSTVPEIITAHHLGIKTVALSLISNMAAGISLKKLSHSDVTEMAKKTNERFSELLENLILSIKY